MAAIDPLDPELISLPRKRMKISPLSALAVATLCAFLLFKLRGDFSYSLTSNSPTSLSISQLATASLDQHVAVEASLDFADALRLRKNKSEWGRRLVPIRGTNHLVWASLPGDPWVDVSPTDRLEGRLKSLQSTNFASKLRALSSSETSLHQRSLSLKHAQVALSAKSSKVQDAFGDEWSLESGAMARIETAVPSDVTLVCSRTDDFSDEHMWRAALTEAGILSIQESPVQTEDWGWIYRVREKGDAASVNERLSKAQLYAAKAETTTESALVPWAELRSQKDELVFGRDRVTRWSNVINISVSARRPAPEVARIVVHLDGPASYRSVPWICVALSFAVIFLLWAAWREMRMRST